MDINQFLKRVKELDVVEVFADFTIYYDRKDKSLLVWNGNRFYGIKAMDFYKYLSE